MLNETRRSTVTEPSPSVSIPDSHCQGCFQENKLAIVTTPLSTINISICCHETTSETDRHCNSDCTCLGHLRRDELGLRSLCIKITKGLYYKNNTDL